MNNIKKKNILYKSDAKNLLPHDNRGDSITFASNSNITDIRINNTLQLLINNDLYLENKILHEMKYLAGPEFVLNIEQISALPNGSKRWASSNDYTLPLQIYRKIEEPLSASIYQISDQSVKFITSIGDIIFIAFNDKLMYDNGLGLIDCKDNNENNVDIIGYYTCTDGTFFISETNLYELRLIIDSNNNIKYSLIKIDTGDNLNNLRCIAYDSTNNMFYIGGINSYMARGFYNKNINKVDFISDIKFCKDDIYGLPNETNDYLNNITVNAILLLDDSNNSINKDKKLTNILVATDAGIFRSDLRNYLNVNSFEEFNDKTCIGIVEKFGILYVLTSDGYLYYKNDNNFIKYTETLFTSPKSLISHSSGIYIVCEDGIYKYTQFDGSDPELEYDGDIDVITVKSLNNENKVIFAAKNNIIYYYDNPLIVKNFQLASNFEITLLIALPRKNKEYTFDVYILAKDKNNTSNNRNSVFATYIEFKSNAEYDYNKIYGLSSNVTNCNAITIYNNNCYYAKNNTIYNLATGFNKVLDDLNISYINYSEDNNCIALATNTSSLYILDPQTFEIQDILNDSLINIKYITQSKNIIYFCDDNKLYAVPIDIDRKLGESIEVCNIENITINDLLIYSSYNKFNNIQTYNNNIYILLNNASNGMGPILSSLPYYVRYSSSTTDHIEEGSINSVKSMAFPVMSAITEVDISSAIGLSSGTPYKLIYSPEDQAYSEIKIKDLNTNTNPINAVCTAGKKLFIATDDAIYQYTLFADNDGNNDINNLSGLLATTTTNISDVKKLIYSGTDSTFNMRVYALTDSSLFMYKPIFNISQKFNTLKPYKLFIEYTDIYEGEEELADQKECYFVFVGLTYENTLEITITNNKYEVVETGKYIYSFDDIDNTDGTNDIDDTDKLFERTPYNMMFLDNSYLYVAYTAKTHDDKYIDCIAAIKTIDILNARNDHALINTSDFYIVNDNIAGHNDGLIKFSGFDIPRPKQDEKAGLDNEDIDIITAYTHNNNENKLLIFKVDSNITGQSFANTVEIITDNINDDESLSYFHPDCFSIIDNEEKYYIILPALTIDGDILIELYEYIINNKTIYKSRYYIKDIDKNISDKIKDIFVIKAPFNSLNIIEFLIVTSEYNLYTIQAKSNDYTNWLDNYNSILSDFSFNNIKRISLNQLIGYGNNFIYDFVALLKIDYLIHSDDNTSIINNVFLTNNGESANFIFVQDNHNYIYAIEPDNAVLFNEIERFKDIDFSLTKVNDCLFIIDWTNEKIYKENINDGNFIEISLGNFNINYIDGCICYDNNIYYLCVLQSDNIMNIYLIDITGNDKSIIKKYTFENIPLGYIPFIISDSDYNGINKYIRNQLFKDTNILHYAWPLIVEDNNTGNFNYLDFNSDFYLKYIPLSFYNEEKNYLRIDKNNDFFYGIYKNESKIIIESLINDIKLPISGDKTTLTCDSNSDNGWFSGNMYFFETNDGIRYYNSNSNEWNTIPESQGNYNNIINFDNNYYFLKDDKNLYINIKLKSFNLLVDPIIYKIEDIDNNPIQLINGSIYAGLICLNNITNILALYILKPNTENVIEPSSINSINTDDFNSTYFISVNLILFEDLLNNTIHSKNIVPIGNFLKEIIIYDGVYLHIANINEKQLININKINNTLPWSEFGEVFNNQIRSSIKFNNIKYVASNNSGLYSFSNGSTGLAMKSVNPSMKINNINARSFYKVEKNNFYIPTDKGIYRYLHIDNIPSINRITTDSNFNIKLIISYNFTGLIDTYIIVNAFDDFIYQSENIRVWQKLFKPIKIGSLESIYLKNIREWYFGGSSGLYKSEYRYREDNDIQKFTEADLYSLYNNIITSDINESIEDKLFEHEISKSIILGHSSNTLIDNINNNLLSTNFNGLLMNGWQKSDIDDNISSTDTNKTYKIQNDIVFELYWGNNNDSEILLNIENKFVTTSNAKFTYLVRRWMSGITEIYINIPTTNTYYINHLPSTPNYTIDSDSTQLTAANVSLFGKDKLIFKHDPNEDDIYTKLTLIINKPSFNIDLLIGVLACGNSLPLKIYKDDINKEYDYKAALYFNSYIAPTVMISLSSDDTKLEFKFACFGSDEQVIKLEFIDTLNKFNDLYCRLIFNPNGLNIDNDLFIKLYIPLNGQSYKLRRNEYQWPSDLKIFIGWTFTRNPQTNPPNTTNLNGFYTDMSEITSDEIIIRVGTINQGDDIILYAVWTTYLFTSNDTTLLLNSSILNNICIIKNVNIINNTKLKDKIVVKFEEIES